MIKSAQTLALEAVATWTPRRCSFEAAEFARAVVAKLSPAGPPRARALLLACSALCEWGLEIGLEANERSLLNEAVIERHIATAMDKATPASRRTRRANLRFVARALGLAQRAEPSRIARDGPAVPYSSYEIEAYFALARGQGLRRRRAMESMLCLGLGAGLDGRDMRYVTGDHVVFRSGGLVVVVEGARARVVPVLARYQAMLAVCAEFSGAHNMVGGIAPTRKNVTTPVLARLSGGVGLKRLSVSRMRSSWLAEQLGCLGVPALLRAAGLKYSQRLFDLALSLPQIDEAELVFLLGGSS